jgi:hypothetical protein
MGRRGYGFLVVHVVIFAGVLATPARADAAKTAEKMCAALGGWLDDGTAPATTGQGIFDTTVALNPGRSVAYRQRIASNAAQSHLLTSAH